MSEAATATPLPLFDLEERQSEPLLSQPVLRAPVPAGKLTVQWDDISPTEWSALLARVPHANLEQGAPYGRAMLRTRLLMPRFGVIEVGGAPVGIVQLQERELWRFRAMVLERGPLWFDPNPPVVWWRDFIDQLAVKYPARLSHLRRFIPELPPSDINRRLTETSGFRVADPNGLVQRSIRLDLKTGEAARYRALRADWRHHLASSERARLKIAIETTPASIGWLLARRAEAGKAGAAPYLSRRFIAALARGHFAEGTGHLYKAIGQSGPAAGALVLGHGRSATYLFGWTSQLGRASGALHFLMWRAMQDLESKYQTLDLGSFNSAMPEDVIAFKRGLGGEPYELLPMFR